MIKDRSLKIGVVCGEHSGDTLGAHLISELKKHKDIELLGVGGPKLENLGLNSQFNFEELQIMGIVDPILNYRNLSMRRKKLTESFIKNKIDIFIGIDSPDFNIKIHKSLKEKDICKNIQLVSPSVWAWRQNRTKLIKRFIDLTLCLFHFEHEFYKNINHESIHLGHPFKTLEKASRKDILDKYSLDDTKKYISILPGSRESEIKNMLPAYIKFIENYSIPNSDTAYLIPASTNKIANKIYEMTNSLRNVVVEPFAINEFLSISEFSIVTSGTASLESAVIGCPPIICYKTNPLNYFIISRMLKVQNIGLPNLLLGDSVFPELVQNECNQKNLLLAADKIFKITPQMNKIQSEIKEKLCGVGFANAAKSILDL